MPDRQFVAEATVPWDAPRTPPWVLAKVGEMVAARFTVGPGTREMIMSDIDGELARVLEAFQKPTLRLLDRKWAPLVLAVFKSSFSRDQRSVTAERLHTPPYVA